MADIGLVGLGVMGANLSLNMAEKGYTVAVYNRTTEKTDAFMKSAGPLAARLVPCRTLTELAEAVAPPRPVVIMVKAGDPVDEQAQVLSGHFGRGDILIDCGNANFRDTRRRVEEYKSRGIDFLGVGVSGGEEGARHGPSIMAGGSEAAWARVQKIFDAISAKFDGEPCCARVGPEGAGHFVKTIHNGIEYADMQMIAEIYGLMRDGMGLSAGRMAKIFRRWNEGPLKSYLIEITAKVLEAADPLSGRPMVEVIQDTAGQKGTGRWSVMEAQELGVPATVIEAAILARSLSAQKPARLAAEAMFGAAPRKLDPPLNQGDTALSVLENALLAGKIVAYAQGFEVLGKASETWGWHLPLATVAKIWRAGCIIRSVFLDDIARAVAASGATVNLMTIPPFAGLMKAANTSLRAIVAEAALKGIPVPALSAALAYFDYLRTGRSTADLTQAQRDFFGAHGFERTDAPGKEAHGPWALGLG
ncbi:MAG TPA: NADP-dependent phosphogluconate dehydrogenase [Bauldia sp.]|nr:NADP-dependent phosphogluconate dehydrogenase [Bauldia sp.]